REREDNLTALSVLPAVPRVEPLGRVGQAHDDGGHQYDFGHDIEMLFRDDGLHAEAPAHQRSEAHHHREAGVHGADYEIGWEDRLLPTRHEARGGLEAHPAM